MRKKHALVIKLAIVLWLSMIYYIYHSQVFDGYIKKSNKLFSQLDLLENEIGYQRSLAQNLLETLQALKKENLKVNLFEKNISEEKPLSELEIPVLLIACNRELAVRRSLDLLLKYRPNPKHFPIIVSQDCGHLQTRNAVLSYGDKVTLIQQPDLSDISVPLKEKKFKGYFLIARHYKWALDQIFYHFQYKAVIIVEDDLDIAPDFYEYFSATYSLLCEDSTLWCVSAWNDNGKENLVDTKNGHASLYRTDFFPGLGWMMLKEIWDEVGPKWPKSYWDDWMRAPDQRKGRSCIRPEISRTRTFGKKGISNGLFYEKYLKFIHLYNGSVPFTKLNLDHLKKENYDKEFDKLIQVSQVVTVGDIKSGNLQEGQTYKILYHTKDSLKKITKSLGLMDDFKAGVPRTSYKGVISFFYRGKRIHLYPGNNWKGYNP